MDKRERLETLVAGILIPVVIGIFLCWVLFHAFKFADESGIILSTFETIEVYLPAIWQSLLAWLMTFVAFTVLDACGAFDTAERRKWVYILLLIGIVLVPLVILRLKGYRTLLPGHAALWAQLVVAAFVGALAFLVTTWALHGGVRRILDKTHAVKQRILGKKENDE